MSRDTPRRPSRITTPKPRKIAGRDSGSNEPTAPERPTGPVRPAGTAQPPKPPKPPVAKEPPLGDAEPTESALGSPKVTRVLLVLVAGLVVLLVLQAVWFFLHDRENDERADDAVASASESQENDEEGPIPVPSGRPVIMTELAVQEGVDAAAAAAQTMFERNWETYDDGVDNAVTLMTEKFADEYRATTDDVRQEFIEKKTDVQVNVVAQSVIRANDSELEALIFLNQYIFRGEGEDATNTYTPYRAVITMVHTDKGWLVDGLQTQ